SRGRPEGGLAVPGTGSDQRPRPVDGRPLPLLRKLAARRPAPVRRLRPRQPEAARTALARRGAGQRERRRARAARRAADAPALLRRPPALRHQLALLDLGQSVLPRSALLAPARELRPERRHGGRSRFLRRLLRPPERARPRPRGPAPERRLHDGDLPVITAHVMGIPVEESILQLMPAGAVMAAAAGIAVRGTLDRVRRLRRRDAGAGRS